MRRCLQLLAALLLVLPAPSLLADNAFDLIGPKIDIHVKRGDLTLPISRVPNLLPGDRLWVHPDFPDSQANHFVLVIAFLRGATNQPPNDWFTRVETWTPEVRSEGVFITVPAEAEQALLFLAPETGGDFATLRKAVHDRPGLFVRAAQDLQAASWDRVRLDTYLNDVKATNQTDPKILKESADLSARSLGIKVDNQCFDRPTDQQAPCLTQHSEGIVLDDSGTTSLVDQITNGNTGDLMNQISYSQVGAYGMYSAYVGAIVDTARILASLHTAHFQYIPALALPDKDILNLRLNTAPSFRDPKSVVVVALPPIGPAKFPPLRPANPADAFCAQKPDLVLPVEGAPLVFAAGLAHDLVLHIEAGHIETGHVEAGHVEAGHVETEHVDASKPASNTTEKAEFDIPVTAESSRGGLVITGPLPKLPAGELSAVLRGKWGFDEWQGPRFHLRSAGTDNWQVASSDQSALVVGRQDTLHIDGTAALCVDTISLRQTAGTAKTLSFKTPSSGQLEITVPMEDAAPGVLTFEIHQYGAAKPDTLDLHGYAEAAAFDRLTLASGDSVALLKGNRLDEVAKVTLQGISFQPAALSRIADYDQLALKADGNTSGLNPTGAPNPADKKPVTASVELIDGRKLKTPVTILPARPRVSLLSRAPQDDGAPALSAPVHFNSPDDLPLDRKLVFSLQSVSPPAFPRTQNVEVAAVDASFHSTLTIASGALVLEDAHTALGSIDPLKTFGPSAFGPIHMRAVSPEGVPGDWINLGTLVRTPAFHELRCPRAQHAPCTLSGSNLFLALAVGASPELSNATDIPAGFTGAQIAVPHPANGSLYLRLRDDPGTIQTLTLPITPIQAPPAPVSSPATGPVATPDSAPVTAPASTPDSTPAPAPQQPAPATSPTNN